MKERKKRNWWRNRAIYHGDDSDCRFLHPQGRRRCHKCRLILMLYTKQAQQRETIITQGELITRQKIMAIIMLLPKWTKCVPLYIPRMGRYGPGSPRLRELYLLFGCLCNDTILRIDFQRGTILGLPQSGTGRLCATFRNDLLCPLAFAQLGLAFAKKTRRSPSKHGSQDCCM
jgi:hypothetical protein